MENTSKDVMEMTILEQIRNAIDNGIEVKFRETDQRMIVEARSFTKDVKIQISKSIPLEHLDVVAIPEKLVALTLEEIIKDVTKQCKIDELEK